jgi:hypothetical protein
MLTLEVVEKPAVVFTRIYHINCFGKKLIINLKDYDRTAALPWTFGKTPILATHFFVLRESETFRTNQISSVPCKAC